MVPSRHTSDNVSEIVSENEPSFPVKYSGVQPGAGIALLGYSTL